MIYELIDAWLSMKAFETARSYRSIIKEWCLFLGCIFGPDADSALRNASRKNVLEYLGFLRTKRGQQSRYDKEHTTQSNATIRKKMEVLRLMYQILMDEGVLSINPWASGLLTKPNAERKMKRKTEALNKDEVKSLLLLPDSRKRSGIRDLALMSICLGAGLRISEALKLTIQDILIDYSSGDWSLRLREPKSGPDQQQGLPAWAQEALSLLVAQRRSDSDLGRLSLLFVRYNSKEQVFKPLQYRTAARILKKYFLKAGLRNKSPHSLRKSSINFLARDGEQVINIRDFARHKSVTSTEKYLNEVNIITNSIAKKIKI